MPPQKMGMLAKSGHQCDALSILAALHSHKYGKDAAVVGRVVAGSHVIMETAIGGERFIEPPMGDPVPRVC